MKLALVSDTHLAPRAAAFGDNWQAARRWIAAQQPDLVVHLGDISADGEHDPAELQQVSASLAGLAAPLHCLPGNHDIGDQPDAAALAQYRRSLGADRWSLLAAGWQLIGLNAQLLGAGDAEEQAQFDWLQQELARSAAPLGLLLHKPLVAPAAAAAADAAEPGGRYVPAAAAQRLLRLLRGRSLRFVLSGHTHQAHRFSVDGVEQIWVPSTSFCIPDAVQERIGSKCVGAMLLQLEGPQYRAELHAPPGMVRHNLLDFDSVYPQLGGVRQRLGQAGVL